MLIRERAIVDTLPRVATRRAVIRAEIMRQCDGLDGLMDGLISNYPACREIFDTTRGAANRQPWAAVRCANNIDPNPSNTSRTACLTDGHIETLHFLLRPYRTATALANGVAVFGGYLPGPGIADLLQRRDGRYAGQEGGGTEVFGGYAGEAIVTGALMRNLAANPLTYIEGGALNQRRVQMSQWMDATNTNPSLSTSVLALLSARGQAHNVYQHRRYPRLAGVTAQLHAGGYRPNGSRQSRSVRALLRVAAKPTRFERGDEQRGQRQWKLHTRGAIRNNIRSNGRLNMKNKWMFFGVLCIAAALPTLVGCGGGSGTGGSVVSSGSVSSADPHAQPAGSPPDTPPTGAAQTAAIQLPIEVLGPAGYVESVEFELDDPDGIELLALRCHRCGWRDSSVQSGLSRGPKGSVRLNGGRWVALDNAAARVSEPDKSYGGIGGGFNTVRFTVPISGAVRGANKLEFRFNADDGVTSGYRILELNLRDRAGSNRLRPTVFVQEDPSAWRVEGSASDVVEGQALWAGKVALRESPLSSRQLKASCASCHAADGRDLKYFNFSSWSIEARSMFHGLSERQGKQIAAYIRNLDVAAPPQARPWNPPYQPGPNLDSRSVHQWAAGAGVDAVLSDDLQMVPHLFPSGTSLTEMRKVVNKSATLNVREMPVALQFPDWNDWLPDVHPVDAFGASLLAQKFSQRDSLVEMLRELHDWFGSTPANQLVASGQLAKKLNDFAQDSSNFPNDVLNAAMAAGVPEPLAKHSQAKWSAVQQWELMQRYGLEDKAPAIHRRGEARSWLTVGRNVFEIAPHRSSGNLINFDYQSEVVGKYQSTAWYQLQLTLNAGNGNGVHLWPVDWNYQPGHIAGLSKESNVWHGLRYMASHTKMLQQYADGKTLGGRGDDRSALNLRQIHIARYLPGSEQGHGPVLDHLPASLRLNAYEAMLNATVDVLERYRAEEWRPPLYSLKNDIVEPIGYILTYPDIPIERMNRVCFEEGNLANCWYSAIPYFRQAGVSEATLNRLITWGQQMWPAPQNNWAALRR
jgi:cytochrome c553